MINFKLAENKEDMIKQLIDYHKYNLLPRYNKLYAYYKGHHRILDKVSPINSPNNRIVNPYPSLIVNTVQGYFLGQPVEYESKDTLYHDTFYNVLNENNEDDENVEVEKTLSIMGEAFELVYMDEESNVKFTKIDNEQIIVHYTNTINPQIDVALRYYTEKDYISSRSITKVEVYYKDIIEYYTKTEDKLILDDTIQHYFGAVPIIHYLNNKEIMGDFEIALSLIDDYDTTLSNSSNEFEYFRNAYLILKGFEGTTDEELADAVAKRAFKIDADGEISFLTKEINDTAIMNHLNTLDKDIHKACNIPNLMDESFASNLSGVALKYKLWGFENLISAKERKFSQSLINRAELITTALNLKGFNFNYKDIKTKFTRNLPSNILEQSQIIANLKDVIPIENLIVLLPFIDDKEAFLENLKKMQETQNKDNNSGSAVTENI